MTYPKLSFQVRARSTDTLADMAHRVAAALDCTFAPANGTEFEADEAMEAGALGLVLHLIGEAHAQPGTEVTYVLRGLVRPDVEAQLDLDASTISISEYVLGVLRLLDNDGWYIADRAELLTEAGLPMDDAPSG